MIVMLADNVFEFVDGLVYILLKLLFVPFVALRLGEAHIGPKFYIAHVFEEAQVSTQLFHATSTA
jgi:hypothetical protein